MLNFVNKFETQNIVAVVALVLAYLAYRKSVIDEYKSWLDLAKSFQHELKYAKEWIGNSYKNIDNKGWVNPSSMVYPLTSEAAKALIWKGHPPRSLFSDEFFDKLAIYNERVQAFNHFLTAQAINYVLHGIYDEKSKLYNEKTNHINKIIHNGLIGSTGEYDLHSHYEYFRCELRIIENTGLSKIPWYFKNPIVMISLLLILYLTLDYFLQ